MSQDFEVVIRSLKRTRVTYIVWGILYLVGSLIMIGTVYQLYFLYQESIPSNEALRLIYAGMSVTSVVFGILALFYGIRFISNGIRWWNIEQSPLYTLLKEHPHHIVWIFETPTKDKRELTTVNVWLVDGAKHSLYVKESESYSLVQTLSHFAPQARLGYHRQWVKEYKQDPSNFGKIPRADS